MTKEQIDKWFTQNYNYLLSYAKTYIILNKRKYDNSIIVGDAYMFALANKINTENDLIKLMQYYIKQNIVWSNSNINYSENKHNINKVEIEMIDTIDETYDYEAIINDFYTTLNSMEQRVWDICWTKCQDTKTKLAKYLNISTSNAALTIKQFIIIQNKLRSHVEEYIKINKK